MKVLSLFSPLVKLVRHFGFLYRLIGIGLCFVFFSQNFKDLLFLSSSNGVQPMTVEEVISLPKDQIPRYLKLKNLVLLNDNYVATQNEDTGTILDASYPVYSTNQLADLDSTNMETLEAYILIKDKDFSEASMTFMIDEVDGLYDNESFGEVRDILSANGVKVSSNAILIVKEKPPSFSSSLMWTLLSGLFGLTIIFSFFPDSWLGITPPPEDPAEEEQTA